MKLNFVTLDVFTSTRFAGNQLAVVTIPANLVQSITYGQKRQIAKEFNLAETVFVLEPTTSSEEIPVNIYLPSTEIPFAGHPTIGTGIYLLKYQGRDHVKAIVPGAGRVDLTLDSKANTVSAGIPHAVHLDSHTVPCQFGLPGPERCSLFSIVKGMTFALVPLPDLQALGKATRGFDDPREEDDGWAGGFRGTKYYVDQGFDGEGRWLLRTRMQGAANDPVEDAATGSASCALASYLALYKKSTSEGAGPFEFHIMQGVEMGRKSDIFVSITRTADGKNIESVVLRGTAIKVMEGSIELD